MTLKNFRSMWQGETEGNLERVLQLLKAMSPIAVIVDEADAQLGDRSSSGDSGVSNRVFAQDRRSSWATRSMRGKVIWFLLTCRPDLLPGRPEAPGPRRGAHRAVLSGDARRSASPCCAPCRRRRGMQIALPEAEKFFLERGARALGRRYRSRADSRAHEERD